MIVAVVTVSHLFLEVHGRYHASLVPLLGILAAAGIQVILGAARTARAVDHVGP
jgi:hypothetical protein